MDIRTAEQAVMKFGKYKGQTVEDIASTEEGIRYLNWLLRQDFFKTGYLHTAIDIVLRQPDVERALNRIIGDG